MMPSAATALLVVADLDVVQLRHDQHQARSNSPTGSSCATHASRSPCRACVLAAAIRSSAALLIGEALRGVSGSGASSASASPAGGAALYLYLYLCCSRRPGFFCLALRLSRLVAALLGGDVDG